MNYRFQRRIGSIFTAITKKEIKSRRAVQNQEFRNEGNEGNER